MRTQDILGMIQVSLLQKVFASLMRTLSIAIKNFREEPLLIDAKDHLEVTIASKVSQRENAHRCRLDALILKVYSGRLLCGKLDEIIGF